MPAVALLAAALFAGCVHRTVSPPGPGTSQGTPPDLRGSNVMVFPMQRVAGVVGDVDAEIAFGLKGRGRGIRWILPAELEDAMRRAPSLDTRIHGLRVAAFGQAEVKRIGDPLYGQIRRLAELVDAEVAFVPLSAVAVADTTGAGTAVEVAATLIDVDSGNVLWFGVVEGDAGPRGGPGALASAADVLARRLLWYEGRHDG